MNNRTKAFAAALMMIFSVSASSCGASEKPQETTAADTESAAVTEASAGSGNVKISIDGTNFVVDGR